MGTRFQNDMSVASGAMALAVVENAPEVRQDARLVCAGAIEDTAQLAEVLDALGLMEGTE